MSMIEIHDEALQSPNVIYHQFLLRFRSGAKSVYGIVEGKEDPMFYRGLIERSLPEGWDVELIRSGSKSNVLSAISAFDWQRHSRKQICFFVDRDLQDFVNGDPVTGDNLYVTDGYSIENDVITFSLFRRLLEEVLNLTDLEPSEVEALQSIFDKNVGLFRYAMQPVMAQIVLWRRAGQQPYLDSIKPKELFAFVDANLCVREEFSSSSARVEYAARCVQLAPSLTSEIAAAEVEFKAAHGPEKFIRGKYLLWFLVEFALETHKCVSRLFVRFRVSPKARFSMGAKNAMIVVAPRARCPQSLQRFLDSTYGQFVREGA
jgi:hypothetical protein